MVKRINRITVEQIEDGIVTNGTITSAEKWADAYYFSMRSWQRDSVIATILMREMEHFFDECCEDPKALAPYEARLAAIKQLLSTMDKSAVDQDEMYRLLRYEEAIRSDN